MIAPHGDHLGVESGPVQGLLGPEREGVDLLIRIGGAEASPTVPHRGMRLPTGALTMPLKWNEANSEVFDREAKDVDNELWRVCRGQGLDVSDGDLDGWPESALWQYRSAKGMTSGVSDHIVDRLGKGRRRHLIIFGARQAMDDDGWIGDQNPQQIGKVVCRIVQKAWAHADAGLAEVAHAKQVVGGESLAVK